MDDNGNSDVLIDECAEHIHKQISSALKSSPPILVTLGLNTFFIQKYLESYPLTSLFLIDPVSVNPFLHLTYYLNSPRYALFQGNQNPTLLNLLSYFSVSDTANENFMNNYADFPSKSPSVTSTAFRQILQSENKIYLEPNSLPIFPIFSRTEDKVLSQIQNEFLDFHQIDEDQVLYLPANSPTGSLSMISPDNSQLSLFHNYLLHWSDATL